MTVAVAYASVVLVQHVAIQAKPAVLALAVAEVAQLVSVRHLEPTAMLQIMCVNVQQVWRLAVAHQTLVLVAYVGAEAVQHVAILVKPVALDLANVDRPRLVSVRQPELTAMLQITYVNVPQV